MVEGKDVRTKSCRVRVRVRVEVRIKVSVKVRVTVRVKVRVRIREKTRGRKRVKGTVGLEPDSWRLMDNDACYPCIAD